MSIAADASKFENKIEELNGQIQAGNERITKKQDEFTQIIDELSKIRKKELERAQINHESDISAKLYETEDEIKRNSQKRDDCLKTIQAASKELEELRAKYSEDLLIKNQLDTRKKREIFINDAKNKIKVIESTVENVKNNLDSTL
mmetsp:Transcript_27976/g.24662  ORF Transcript_27976/g.24662 Transcript_27976/m.24662 type:complete len:146 (-) Transcript_27976:1294-1731(-)